jgi:hypothetical protein
VALPVDLREAKVALQPIYDRLMQEGRIAPLMGGKADAARALARLMEGPDQAPLSIVDAALGDLKALARVEIPELRTQGQGVAAQAVQALDRSVRETAQRAGRGALSALEEGRGATVAKYQAGDVFESIRAEPVQAYRQAVAPKDAGIAHLRRLREMAPGEVPKIARAYLDDLMQTATQEGGFGRADRLYADWQKLGPETKRILFSDPEYVKDLDNFFLLAKTVSQNPNPSGTARVLTALNVGTIPASYVVAKLLYSPTGVKLLTQGLRIPARNYAGRAAWTAEVTRALGESSPSALPMAAEGPAAAPPAGPPRRR